MTTQLIRMMAKEVAGTFYEGYQRSLRFRVENPDQDVFVNQHWPHYVQEAKKALTELMIRPDTPQHQKDAIEEELIEHFNRSQSGRAREVLQVDLSPREREDVKHVDNTPELRSVGA
jgi:hypothetical protein